MAFVMQPDHIEAILRQYMLVPNGPVKTMTRRIAFPSRFECTWDGIDWPGWGKGLPNRMIKNRSGFRILRIMKSNGTTLYGVGRTYGIKSSRTSPIVVWRPNGDDLPFYLVWTPEHTVSGKEWKAAHLAGGWQELRVKITALRREYLQDITENDAHCEGVLPQISYRLEYFEGNEPLGSYVAGFHQVWDKINNRSPFKWRDNPVVNVITFELVAS